MKVAAERRLITCLSLGAFGTSASMRVADAQLPALGDAFGVGLAAAAQVITVFSIAYGIVQLAYGPLADRRGKWRVLAAAVLASAVTAAACALAPSFRALLLARSFAGATCAAVIPLSMAWIGDAVPYQRRQPVLAQFLIGQIVGMACGQWLGGLASDFATWRLPFAFLAVWFAVTGMVLWQQRRTAEAFAPITARSGHPLHEAAYVVSQPWARVVLATVFAEAVVLFGPFAFLATHLHLHDGVALSTAGAIVTLYAAGGLFFALAARRLVPRLGEPGLARAGGVLVCLGLAGFALSSVWWTAPLACGVAGFGFYMLHNTLQINATQMAPQARGAAVSLFAAALFVGQTVGVGLAALAVERFGTSLVIVAGAIASAGVGVAFAALRVRHVAEVQ
jgi:predicted MFS family arabinose efflux permease